jgi:hypothetical protein
MMAPNEPLTTSILAIMYFGDVVFAISGALTAARYRMDVLGFTGFHDDRHHYRHRRRHHPGSVARPHRVVDPGSARIDFVRGGVLGHLFLDHQ